MDKQQMNEMDKYNQMEKEQMDLLKEGLKLANETVNTQENIKVQLKEDKQNLNKIENQQIKTENEIEKTKYYHRGIKSWWGSFLNLFKKPKIKELKHKEEEGTKIQNQNQQFTQNVKTQHKNPETKEELIDEMQQTVERIIDNSKITGQELTQQNKQIDDIKEKGENHIKKIEKLQKTENKILKK